MQNFIWPAVLTVTAGISVLIQQTLNANLRAELNSAAWSGFMSYFLGVVCMIGLTIALRDPVPSSATIARVPLWAWSGGVFGAIFIALSIVALPKLGGAVYIALLEPIRKLLESHESDVIPWWAPDSWRAPDVEARTPCYRGPRWSSLSE